MKCPECGSGLVFSPPKVQEGSLRVYVCKSCGERWTKKTFTAVHVVEEREPDPDMEGVEVDLEKDWIDKDIAPKTWGDMHRLGYSDDDVLKLAILRITNNKPVIIDNFSDMQKRAIEIALDDRGHWIDRIPMRLKKGLIRYRDHGTKTGDGLKGLLENDLRKFLSHADPETHSVLKELVWWLNRFMPSLAYGNPASVEFWIGANGLDSDYEEIQKIAEYWPRKTQNELRELGRESEL